MGYSIGKNKSENIQEVIVNEFGDSIRINAADATLRQKYNDFLAWLYPKVNELQGEAERKEQQYAGRQIVTQDKEGNAVIDTEQLSDLIGMQNSFYSECLSRVDEIFGQDVVKKYFRSDYEVNAEFVPDEQEMIHFIDEVTGVASEIYGIRRKTLDQKYSKGRKGKHSKTKAELIAEAKAARAAETDA